MNSILNMMVVALTVVVALSPSKPWAQGSVGMSAKDRVAVEGAYSDTLSAVGGIGGNMLPKTTVKTCKDKPVQIGNNAPSGGRNGTPSSLLDGFNGQSNTGAAPTIGNIIVYCP